MNISTLKTCYFLVITLPRSIKSATALQASHIVREAHLIECASLKIRGTHRIYIRNLVRGSCRERSWRIGHGEIVKTSQVIVRCLRGEALEDVRVRHQGMFRVKWVNNDSGNFVDIAELSKLSELETECLHSQDYQMTRAREAFQRQKQLMI